MNEIDAAGLMDLCNRAVEENLALQMEIAELRAVVDSMKRIEAQRYKSAAAAFGLTPPAPPQGAAGEGQWLPFVPRQE